MVLLPCSAWKGQIRYELNYFPFQHLCSWSVAHSATHNSRIDSKVFRQDALAKTHFGQDIYKTRGHSRLTLFLTSAYKQFELKQSLQRLLFCFSFMGSEYTKRILNEMRGNTGQREGTKHGQKKRLGESRRFWKLKQRLMLHWSTNSTFPEMERVRWQTLWLVSLWK